MFRPFKTLTVLLTLLSLVLGSAVVVTPVRAAGECYVKADAGGANDGTSWADAYTDLQLALGTSPCTEIWVAAGTYKPTTGTDRNATFQLKSGVALYGGFAGMETTRDQRDPATNVTVLSGDIDNNDSQTPIITDITTVTGNTTNSYHVVTGATGAALDGFTVTAGNANGTTDSGGGMYNNSSSPTVTNVTFSGNSAIWGGGMYNGLSTTAVLNVTFVGNYARWWGGGVFNYSFGQSNYPSFTNVTFSGNKTGADDGWNMGGGMANQYSSPTITNATFSDNSATDWGGGMANYAGGNPQIRNAIFWNNTAPSDGQIHNDAATSILLNSVVQTGCPTSSICINLITGDPNLGPLADNGGPTQTFALLPGSPAINAGDNATCPATDQRGVARPQGSACDIGAYEYNYIGVYYVKPVASGTGDCQSWANACTLQSALSAAINGDEIWVADGTYKPTNGSDRTATFQLKSGVALLGGFAGTETSREQRNSNPATNGTILSGDLNGDDGANFTNYDNNSYHVVTGHHTDESTLLDGFTVRGGNANLPSDEFGGGFTGGDAYLTISNVIFKENTTSDGGWGGGLYANYSSITLNQVTFIGNRARDGGGMVLNRNAHKLTNVSFSNNTAIHSGGGIYTFNGSNLELTNVTFNGNSAGGVGDDEGGGGLCLNHTSSPTLTNVTFSGNHAVKGGGFFINKNVTPTLINVTFSGNHADESGGGLYDWVKGAMVRNTIFWGNTAPTGAQVYNTSISDSVLQGGCPANSTCTNIISTNPILGALGKHGGYTQTIPLLAGSSAIDTGNDNVCPQTDQRDEPRPYDGNHDGVARCDMGAYEAHPIFVTIDQATIQDDPTTASPIKFTVVFSEPVTGFKTGDVTLSGTAGAKTAVVTGSGKTYNVDVKVTKSGTVIASIPAGVAQDAAGNRNAASTSTDNSVTFGIPSVQFGKYKPPSIADTTTTIFTFNDPDARSVEFLCKLDYEASFSPCKSPWKKEVMAGLRTFFVCVANETVCINNQLDKSTPDTTTHISYTWYIHAVDYAPPTATIVSASGRLWTNQAKIMFKVTFSEPIQAFNRTMVQSSCTPLTSCTINSVVYKDNAYFVTVTPTKDGKVKITIPAGKVKDLAGNIMQSSYASPTVNYDTIPPNVVTIADGPEPNSTQAQAIFKTNELSNFYCHLDTAPETKCSSAPLSMQGVWTGTVPDGSHTFSVRAVDRAGNRSAENTVYQWTVDATPPTIEITDKPKNPTNQNVATFNFKVDDGAGGGVASIQCKLDKSGFADCTSQQTYSGLSEGNHTFVVKATDNLGNMNSVPYTWLVDTTPPIITLTGTPGEWSNNSATFEFSINIDEYKIGSGIASIQCQLDGGSFADCASPQTYTGLSEGSHTFQASATDNAGNVATTEIYSWSVDTTPPEIIIDTSTGLSVAITDTGGSGVQYIYCGAYDNNNNGWNGSGTQCTDPNILANMKLPAGSYTFYVSAYDMVWNSNYQAVPLTIP